MSNAALRKVKQYEKELEGRRYTNVRLVDGITYRLCDYKTSNDLPSPADLAPFKNGDAFGNGTCSHAWFRFTVQNAGPDDILLVSTDKEEGWYFKNPQFVAYVNGKTRQGLDVNHHELYIDEGDNDVCLYGHTGFANADACLTVKLVTVDRAVRDLYYDIAYPLDMLTFLDAESGEYADILSYLHTAVSMLEFSDPAAFGASVRAAHDYLTTAFYGEYCAPQRATTVCVGHTHIDCAWLWTLRQTREKVQRSFSTVLTLMKRYPEYRFTASQPLEYQFLKEDDPDLYRQVKERIREGRWEAEGAMWVEADCNLTSGESLVRQILYGKRFFKEEFGVDSRVLWLPDVFGYSAALPQILKKSGVDWFVTSKISWNDTNRMPYDTFLWRGIDGTAVNTHFLTAQSDYGKPSDTHVTYNGHTGARMISGTYKRYGQKALHHEALLPYGFGDGGGGPTAEQIELLRRGFNGVPGCPNARPGFVREYLERLAASIKDDPRLPVWQGELYLEFHRGTYTTQANNKKNNRRAELLYQNAELLATADKTLFGTPFPTEDLRRGWRILLTNQFHDIIPGSSIREVYEQSDRDYAEAFGIGRKIVDGAESRVASAVDARAGYVVFNPHGFTTEGLVRIDGKAALTPPVPAKGYAAVDRFVTENHVRVDGHTVETNRYRVVFDDCWQIASLYDKQQSREVLQAGKPGNELRLYDDRPDTYDAWEWQAYSREKYHAVTAVDAVKTVRDGARCGVCVARSFGASRIEQTIWFYDDAGQIDFETRVDWHEEHRMLKAAFPVDVHASRATFEIQFGAMERPTHFNTAWEQAKFETCAHKYVDLSDSGYGVSLLNDCKYGHDVHDGVMQLSLLRAPTWPDEKADRGEHTFTYALCPHAGTLADSDTVKRAYYLNEPMTAVRATGKKTTIPAAWSAVTVDRENVICETVKEAENGDGVIVRFYECADRRTTATVKLGLPAGEVFLCDLMENELEKLPLTNGAFTHTFGNFEIVTVKIKA